MSEAGVIARARPPLVPALFTLAVFVAAGLLFVVQPMAARGVLPLLGGSPAVWTTAMLFFQTLLLAGYAWAHWIGTRRGAWAIMVHAGVLAACCGLMLAGGWRFGEPGGLPPAAWVLTRLLVAVGPGFFAIASAGPLLQRWYARAGGPRAHDPYFLYAASNLGSFVGLLAYPLLIEPSLGLGAQTAGWTGALVLCAGLIAACAWRADRAPTDGAAPGPAPSLGADNATSAGPRPDRTPWRVRAAWVGLAFVPSSLMLGATTYLSTDVAAFPLLWVVPLGLYLLTFVLAFARSTHPPLGGLTRGATLALLCVAAAILLRAKHPLPVVVLLHLGALTLGSLLCHARLASLRPAAARLTEFFLFVSIGGALGGVFNAIAAPLLFDGVPEYPIALALVALAGVRTGGTTQRGASNESGRAARRLLAWLPAAALGVWILGVGLFAPPTASDADTGAAGVLSRVLLVGVPLLIAATGAARPRVFAVCLALALLGVPAVGSLGRSGVQTDLVVRTFFGVHRVETVTPGDGRPPHRRLLHGTTSHGLALLDRPGLPTTYYHPQGPIGDVFAGMAGRGPLRVGAVGLGVGSLAAYTEPGDRMTFYEIDRAVRDIAADPGLFPFLAGAAGDVDVELGDGRLLLEASADRFDLLVLDAFSSDAIPVHLLTADAFAMYLDRLAPGGVVAIHLSNQFLDLVPVVGAIAAELEAAAVVRRHDAPSLTTRERDLIRASVWAVVAPTRADLDGAISNRYRWEPIEVPGDARVWTDTYADVVGAIRWDFGRGE